MNENDALPKTKPIIRLLKFLLWAIVILFLCFVLSIPLGMFGNYLVLKTTAEAVLEKQIGVKISQLKQMDISDIGIDLAAHWWFEINYPVDQKFFDKLQEKFLEEKDFRSNGDFQYDTTGFRFYSTSGLDLGPDTLCNDSENSICYISVLAKKGDRNVFIFVSAR